MTAPATPSPPRRGRPLRVGLLAPEFPGCGPAYGVGTYLATLSRALARAGAEVLVLACTGDGCFVADDPASPHLRREPWGPAVLRPLSVSRWLTRQLRQFEADVVEAPNWGGLSACLSGPWARVVRLSTPVSTVRSG
ncbi:MAG: glycosyltransferase, partial [Planctomycetes bacterium]|nr:glycosyltransferase [Planctomycetota bacterium]